MYKRTGIALIISGLTTLGVYHYRRRLVSRLLGLPPALHEVAVERGLRTPMSDGVELVADRYRPRQPGRFPTILVRTPYGRKASGFFVSHRMAERGYNVLVQDVRGRFDSEGDFAVFSRGDHAADRRLACLSNHLPGRRVQLGPHPPLLHPPRGAEYQPGCLVPQGVPQEPAFAAPASAQAPERVHAPARRQSGRRGLGPSEDLLPRLARAPGGQRRLLAGSESQQGGERGGRPPAPLFLVGR